MTATVDRAVETPPIRPSRPARGTGPQVGRQRKRATLTPYLMLFPAAVLFIMFIAAPIGYTLVLSFQKSTAVGLGLGPGSRGTAFAGFDNYVSALTDPDFLASVLRVGSYGLILVPSMLGLALLFALLLDSRRTRARGFSRVTIFLPYAVPAVISSLLWGFLYLPSVSPFYFMAKSFGIPLPEILSGNGVVGAVANIALWGGVGFNMVVMYTSLKAISSDVYEAARLDGASEIQIALRVKVPMIIPSLIMTAIFSMIATLQVFSEPTTLKPLTNAISSTFTPLMKVYRDAFIRNDIYSASATSIVIAVAIFVLSFAFLRIIQRQAFDEETS